MNDFAVFGLFLLGLGVAGGYWILRLRQAWGASTAELREETRRLRGILDAVDAYIFTKDREGRYTFVNEKVSGLFGRPAGKILGKDDAAFFSGASVEEVRQSDRSVLDRGEIVARLETDLAAGGGAPRSYWAMKSPLRDVDGSICGLCGISTDITDRVQIEEALRKSEERFNAAFAFAPVALGITELATGRFLAVNKAFEEVFGYAADEVVGRNSLELGIWLVSEVRTQIRQALEAGQPVRDREVQIRTKDGSLKWVSYSGQFEEMEGVRCLLSGAVDITERKRAEEQLEKRMITLTQPLEGGSITFEELFNLEEIQRIQDEFAQATGVASIITRPDGMPITAPSNFTRLCSEIIRKSPKGCANCFKSDAALGRSRPDGPIVQPCLSGGLWDGGASISVGGCHIANWLIGQVRDETQTEPRMRAYAREIEADEDAFIEAFHAVPAMSRERFAQIAQALFTLANQLSTTAYQNIQQARFIEELRKAESALRESEAQNRALLNAIPDLLFTNRRDGEFLAAHASDPSQLLVPAEQFLHRKLDEVLPQPLAKQFLETYATALDSGLLQEVNYTLPMGEEERHFEARIVPCTEDTVITMVRDTTHHRLAERALQKEQAFSKSLLESLPGIFYLYSYPELRLILCNRAQESHFGYGPGEIQGRHVTEWYPPELKEAALAAIDHVMEHGFGALEALVLHRDGHPIPFYFTAIPFEADGKRYLMGTGVDITERKAQEEQQRHLQDQLQQAQKMESLGSLAGGVAHDMNNVLGAILGLASANMELLPPEHPTHRAFDTISKAAVRGGKVVKSLLSFARQSPAEERELDINAILREETALLERTTLAKVRVVMDLEAELRPVRGDASALSHAFMNLCVNAVDAMVENGTLTLRTRNVNHDWIEVDVEDTGEGMSQEVMDRALDPFFTTKEQGKGTGLGLSMVYSTVKAHQGQLELHSKLGKGTRVCLRLPACVAEPTESEPLSGVAAKEGALCVLVVDDDELVLSSVLMILEVLGHHATPAVSGEAALDLLESGLKPDIAILDMNMPGLGGAGTVPRLRALHPELPVLLATGRADQAVLDLVERFEGLQLLSKPFSIGELKEKLAQAI